MICALSTWFSAFFEHGLRRIDAGLLESGQSRDIGDPSQLLQYEQHVLDRGAVAHVKKSKERVKQARTARYDIYGHAAVGLSEIVAANAVKRLTKSAPH